MYVLPCSLKIFLKRFLIDDEYIPTDLPVNWDDDINSLLKKMKGRGEKAFAVFERQVCFYTTFHDDSFARIGFLVFNS
jgi:hypothetical protein